MSVPLDFAFVTWFPGSSSASQVRLVPRFAVEQGVKQDGTKKIRPVDHLSWSCAPNHGRKRSRACTKAESINGHYTMPGEVKHDHLDDLLATMRMHYQLIGKVGGFPRFALCALSHVFAPAGTRARQRRYRQCVSSASSARIPQMGRWRGVLS